MRRIHLLSLILLFFFTSSALASTNQFSGIFFQPAIGERNFVLLDSSENLEQLNTKFDVYFSYAYRPLSYYSYQSKNKIQPIINNLLTADIQTAFGITDRVQLGIDIPIVIINQFTDPNTIPNGFSSNKFDFGDIRSAMKVNFMDGSENPVGLSLVPFIIFPTGDSNNYVGNVGISGGLKLAIDHSFSENLLLAGNLGYQIGKKIELENISRQQSFLYGVGANYKYKSVAFFGEIDGSTSTSKFFSDKSNNPSEALAGIKWSVGESDLTLNAAAGRCIVCGASAARVRGVLGLSYDVKSIYTTGKPNPRTRKRGSSESLSIAENFFGIQEDCRPDSKDERCRVYENLMKLSDVATCAPHKMDEFKPELHSSESKRLFEETKYMSDIEEINLYTLAFAKLYRVCPESEKRYNPKIHPPLCVDYYKIREGCFKIDKCPYPSKFIEGKDEPYCKTIAKFLRVKNNRRWDVIKGLEKSDADYDGVPDLRDHCPNVKEDYNNFYDADGCPDGGVVAVIEGEIRTNKPILFGFGQTSISKEYSALFKEIANLINENKWIKEVRIGGFADKVGTLTANEAITTARAGNALHMLKKSGVREDVKLTEIPYGYHGTSTEGREDRYRTVSFEVIADGCYIAHPKSCIKMNNCSAANEQEGR